MNKMIIAIMIACFALVPLCAFADDNPAKVEINKKNKDTTGNKDDKEKLTLRLFNVMPTATTYEGGPISVSVDAHDNVPVKTVMAVLIKPDGQESAVHLNLVSGTSLDGHWQISWTMPKNTGSDTLVYGVKVRAEDASNNSGVSNIMDVTVEGKPKSDLKTPQTLPGKR